MNIKKKLQQNSDQNINPQAKEQLMHNLDKNYDNLKSTLNETRVFGVGKATTEKLGTIAKKTGKALAGCAALVCIGEAACLACAGFELKMEAITSLFQGNFKLLD